MELSPDLILILAGVAFVAGFVDSIAGGGGLLNVPAMLLAGMDPVSTLATNKLQGMFGVGAASLQYVRHGVTSWRAMRWMMLASGVAALFGAALVTSLPTQHLKAALPFVLLVIALYFLLSPRLGDVEAEPRLKEGVFASTVVPAIGFYDGAIGPGTGSFFALGFITLRGEDILRATGKTKLLNFASNVGAFVFFLFAGKIVWLTGIGMAIGSVLGARLGATLAVKAGGKIIKPVLVLACSAMAIKLLSDPAHPIWAFFAG
ncbi:UPF0721 transmembrane protein [Terrihabitans soli]|uniref:Probable membrane transporter protein n=2 Tax=Terrihabitans soli TaxID=708113 RepID=A0A6S6QKB5_9HYPH|nr:TSUP family transporter [Terrihabitans soli]BCJ90784.1 UPF0721 transmembrane protein [Terrihabitans soli]